MGKDTEREGEGEGGEREREREKRGRGREREERKREHCLARNRGNSMNSPPGVCVCVCVCVCKEEGHEGHNNQHFIYFVRNKNVMGIMLYHILSLKTASFGSNLSSLIFKETS